LPFGALPLVAHWLACPTVWSLMLVSAALLAKAEVVAATAAHAAKTKAIVFTFMSFSWINSAVANLSGRSAVADLAKPSRAP
jgi:hypothetical protein